MFIHLNKINEIKTKLHEIENKKVILSRIFYVRKKRFFGNKFIFSVL